VDETRQLLDDAVLAAFGRRGRIFPPSAAVWRRMGALLAASGATTVSASRQNDILFAAQAREHGWLIVTRDRDFDALRSQIKGLHVTRPYPARP
jgi:predicted nucleic acid-binding protein